MKRLLYTSLISTLFITSVALAQEEIPLPLFLGGQVKPIWVSISGISGEALQVLQFDLYVQGFSFTAPDAAQFLLSGRTMAT